MARQPKVWWNDQKKVWCSDIGGKRHRLAKGKKNKKRAQEKLKALLEEQALLTEVNGAITVARLCEEFVADAFENLEEKTYDSYKYACQKFVDEFGEREAHGIEPLDITRFSHSLKSSLSDSTRGIVFTSDSSAGPIRQGASAAKYHVFSSNQEHTSDILVIPNELKGKYEYWVCTFAVDNLERARARVEEQGGRVVFDEGERVMVHDNSGEAFMYIQCVE